MQEKQSEWAWQWEKIYDDNQWLFSEWIQPYTVETFLQKDVLDCGCGGGQHINFVAPFASHVTGVDLNALGSAAKNTAHLKNVTLIESDIAKMDLGKQFDIVYSIGVLHHTDDPTASFKNLVKHCKPGGLVIIWVYSKEGNFLNERVLEPLKRAVIDHLSRRTVWGLAHVLTRLVYVPVYTIYFIPFFSFLPFFEYFENWRKLSYKRNLLNVFDKLNAPQTWFIPMSQVIEWFSENEFEDIHISPYKGVSWRGSGTKR